MKKIYTVILALIIMVCASHMNAQENAKIKYMVWEVQLTPLQLENAQKVIAAENVFYKENNHPYMNATQYTNDRYLWYSVPFTEFGDLDEMQKAMIKMYEENPERTKEIQKLFDISYTKVGRMILESQPELSVAGEQMTNTPTGSKFRFFEKFYIKQGMWDKFQELTKKYVDLRRKHRITSAFYTFYPVFGADMNTVYFIDETGNSPSEHCKLNEEQWAKFGEEGKKLWQEVLPIV
ncbi:hypothetical protein [Maribellus maritimus]|uniref:hypothetical protein n=1 Tax=Maribellus maritimus TaxID=2870838 RepID=UPI001EEA61CE|nr:hypothetical protein [Maribellus maritimus]MCG6188381.1 hypothetical protein [Maribellus maritimus]